MKTPAVVGMVAVMLKVGPLGISVAASRAVLSLKVQVSRAPATLRGVQDAEEGPATGETAVAVTPVGNWS